jgi:hypothetical protein
MDDHSPLRRAADRVWDGSGILRRRALAGLADWVKDAGSMRGRLLRLAILAGLGYLGWRLIRAWPWLMWAATSAWCGAAWYLTRKPEAEAEKKPAAAPVEQAPAEPEPDPVEEAENEPAPEPPRDPRAELVDTLLDVVGDAHGIHLRDLYPRLRQRPGWGHLDDPAIRAVLDDYRVPTVRAMSVGGVDGRTGIRREALQALAWEISRGSPLPDAGDPSWATESGPDLRKSRAPLGSESGILAPSRRSESGLDTHVDDALGLVAPRRHGAA